MSANLKARLSRIDRVSGPIFIDATIPEDATDTRLPVAFMMETTIDTSKPLEDQLACWLAVCAAQCDIARIGIIKLDSTNIDRVHRPRRIGKVVTQ